MVEVNLVPDVKQELIRAQHVRSLIVTFSILTAIAAVGIVVALALWVFGAQELRSTLTDNKIKSEHAKLVAVEDLESSLTIQNQLEVLPDLHESKQIDSRIFDVLTVISPAPPYNVSISKLEIDAEEQTIEIEAQAVGGYPALEVFKKTIAATEFHFTSPNGSKEVLQLTTNMSDSDRSYGENADGQKVLRFGLTFEYPEELFAPYLKDARVVGPDKTNVTDSFLGIPKSLFSPKANDTEEEE